MISRLRRTIAILSMAVLGAGSGAAAAAEELTIFAAASLKTALDEITESYTRQTGTSFSIAYAGSSVLARQILHGAPADIYLSANVEWMDALSTADVLVPDSRRNLLSNRLVIVAPAGDAAPLNPSAPGSIVARLEQGFLAMGLVSSVPVGIYGKAALEGLGVWSEVSTQVAQADNARAAMAFVARGEAPLGVVYASDALAEPRVAIVANLSETLHPKIIYPVAQIEGASGARATARAEFVAFLTGPEAHAMFVAQGFRPLFPAEDRAPEKIEEVGQ